MSADVKVNFEREYYQGLCEEMKAVLQLEKEVINKKEKLKKEIIEKAGGDRMEYGINVIKRSRKGAINYDAYMKINFVSQEELEFYRKPTIEYYEVSSY